MSQYARVGMMRLWNQINIHWMSTVIYWSSSSSSSNSSSSSRTTTTPTTTTTTTTTNNNNNKKYSKKASLTTTESIGKAILDCLYVVLVASVPMAVAITTATAATMVVNCETVVYSRVIWHYMKYSILVVQQCLQFTKKMARQIFTAITYTYAKSNGYDCSHSILDIHERNCALSRQELQSIPLLLQLVQLSLPSCHMSPLL